MATRRQLTLFVEEGQEIESVRRVLDPVQSSLIRAHVTLSRAGIEERVLRERLAPTLRRGPFTLRFGPPERFGGHGIIMRCVGGEEQFQELRACVLGRLVDQEQGQGPHITLAHPRNPPAPGNALANASCFAGGVELSFRTVSLIEQRGDGEPWAVLAVCSF